MTQDENIVRAKSCVNQAKKNDRRAVVEVLKQANVYLNTLTKGDFSYDAERIIYLKFLNESLEKILNGADPAKALYLYNENRPQEVSQDRSVILFCNVGLAYEKQSEKNISLAFEAVSQKFKTKFNMKVSPSVVRKAWSMYGSLKGWKEIAHFFEK